MAMIDPHSYMDSDQPKIRHLDWNVTADFENQVLECEAKYQVNGSGSGILDLDTRDLEILGVMGGRNQALSFELYAPDSVLGSRLRIELEENGPDFSIRYRTSPSASALQWLNQEHTAGGKYPYLFSQCQPIHARSMLPLQDTPIVRFTYTARVTVPDALTAVMSAASEDRVRGNQGDTHTFAFDMPQPIPSYLLALAIGNLDSRELGPRSRVFAEPEVLDAAAWEFQHVDDMLVTAEGLFGPYLWERFDFIVMPPAFPYGGMENPRLTFLTPTLLAGDRSMVNVLAHELAHSWTGNLVTNATINDFWLNEGFTVWAEREILKKLEGPEYAAMHSVIGRNGLDQALDQFGRSSALTQLKTDLAGLDPDLAYSQVPYEKGFLFVKLLQESAGHDAFDAFIKTYIERFKFTSITTETFIAFLEDQLPGLFEKVDGKAWVFAPGIPTNVPRIDSSRLDDVAQKIAAFRSGVRLNAEETATWTAEEWQVFLHAIPRPLSEEDCRHFDETFRFGESGNAEIVSGWLCIAAVSGYEPAFETMKGFLGSVGRMKYLKPIYKAMLHHPLTKDLAHEIYLENEIKYHPITKTVLQALFQ